MTEKGKGGDEGEAGETGSAEADGGSVSSTARPSLRSQTVRLLCSAAGLQPQQEQELLRHTW